MTTFGYEFQRRESRFFDPEVVRLKKHYRLGLHVSEALKGKD